MRYKTGKNHRLVALVIPAAWMYYYTVAAAAAAAATAIFGHQSATEAEPTADEL